MISVCIEDKARLVHRRKYIFGFFYAVIEGGVSVYVNQVRVGVPPPQSP